MRKLSKILVLVLALAMMFSLASMFTVSAAQPEYLYLTPNANWKTQGARFAAYFFGNGEKWVSMADSNGDGVYEVKVPTDKVYPNVIFCRMNPSATANNWNNKWNQTADLTISTSGANHYTVKEGTWDKGGGTWSTFGSTCAHANLGPAATCTTAQECKDCGDPVVSALGHTFNASHLCTRCNEQASFTVAGSGAHLGTEWDTGNKANDMTFADGVYTKVYTNVAAGTYAFKVARDHDWGTAYPGSDKSYTVKEAGSTVTITLKGTTVNVVVEAPHTHAFSDATCTEAPKCSCGETQGEALGHDFVKGVCSRCEAVDPDYVPLITGTGTEEDPFVIGSLEALIAFRDSVNAGETTYNAEGVYVALGANIDMSSVDWSVNIGDDCNATFDGIFDGKGYTISNLNSKETAKKADGYVCTGLFGAIYGNAVIKNLTIENVSIDAGEFTGNNVAAVVGFVYSGKGSIENVTVCGKIEINAPGIYGVGAIVGYSYSSNFIIKDCKVEGAEGSYINAASGAGAVIGYAHGAHLVNAEVSGLSIEGAGLVGGLVGIAVDSTDVNGATVSNVVLTATKAEWVNGTGIAAGTISSGKMTVVGVVSENVTGADTLVGSTYAEKPTTVVPAIEARIGDTYYASLQAALNAANGETVVVLRDIVLGSTLVLDGANVNATLDLNGKTIDAAFAGDIVEVLWVKNGATLTITGNGTMLATGDGEYVEVISATDSGKVTIENGTFVSNGCTAIYATRGAIITINGGLYEAKELYNGMDFTLDVNEAEENVGIIVVNGGSFVRFNPANHNNDGANSNKLAEGLHAIAADGVYTVGAHVWADATCTAPQTCVCGATQGTALGHTWVYATCTTPDTCSVCGLTEGEARGHADANPCDHECDWCGASVSDCLDENKDHDCDICGDVMSACADDDKNHFCDVCGVQNSHCIDIPPYDHNCDWCGEKMSEHDYVDGVCSVCGGEDPNYEPPHTHKDTGLDAKCDECGEYFLPTSPFKLEMYQASKKQTYYFTGAMNGYYFATSTDITKAVDLYAEEVEGGYNVYFMSGSTKNYLYIELSGTHINAKFGTTKAVWYVDATYGCLTTVVNGTKYFLGTYSSYVTFGGTAYSRLTASTADVSQYVGRAVSLEEHECTNTTPTVTNPTCTAQGYTTYKCADCGISTKADYVDALGHDLVDVEGLAPTCTATGYTAYKDCSRCTYIEGKETLEKVAHTYENCVCTVCEAVLPALGQVENFDFSTQANFDAVVAGGKLVFTGSFRDNGGSFQFNTNSTIQFVVPANTTVTITGHSAQYGVFNVYLNGEKTVMTGALTFTVKEETKVVIATENASYSYIKGIAVAEYVDRTIVEDTTITFGSEGNYKDSIVDFSGIQIGDNGGNNSQVKNGSFDLLLKAGSKVVIHGYPGYTSYKLNDGEAIESEYYTYIALEDMVLTVTPVSGNNYFYSIEVTLHTGITLVDAKAPTCTEAGHGAYYACECHGALTDMGEVAALGHNYEAVVTAPTCTEAGYTTYTCACGDTYTGDEVAALGHSYFYNVCLTCLAPNPYFEYNFMVTGTNKVIANEYHLVDTEGHGFPYQFTTFTVTEAGHYVFTSDKMIGFTIFTIEVNTEGADWTTGTGASWGEYIVGNEVDLEAGTYYVGMIFIDGLGEYEVTIEKAAEECTEHVDANEDYVCDNCGAELEKPEEPTPEDPTPVDPEESAEETNFFAAIWEKIVAFFAAIIGFFKNLFA